MMATARSIVKGFIFINLQKLLNLFTHLSSHPCLNSTMLNISCLFSTLLNPSQVWSWIENSNRFRHENFAALACSKSEVSAVGLDFEGQRHDGMFITPCTGWLTGSSLICWMASF